MAAVDCSDSNNHETCRKYEIKSFPTIKLFPPDAKDSEQLLNKPETYSGSRSAGAIAGVIMTLVSATHVRVLSPEDSWEEKPSQWHRFRVVLFTDKPEPPLLYKSLSWKYHHLATFYESRKGNERLVEKFNVQHFPSVFVFKDDAGAVEYKGEMNASALMSFLDDFFEIPVADVELITNLHVLEGGDLEKIDADEEIWIVGFFADPKGTRCIESTTEFDEVVKRVREMVRVGIFNVTAHARREELEEMGVKQTALNAHPCKMTIVRFPFGKSKRGMDEYEIYEEALNDKKLQDFALEANDVRPMRLNAETIVAFVGMMEGDKQIPTPKVLLFSSFESCPSVFSALAMSMRHWKADFGFVPPTETKLQEEFRVKNVPTLLLMYFDPSAEPGKQVLAPQYQGPLRFGAMKGWIEALMIALKIDKKEHHDPFFVATETKNVARIQTEENLGAACNASVPLCAIVVLDEKHEKFQNHLEWLETLVLRRTNEPSPFSFAWVHGGDANNLLQAFGVGTGDVPTVIIYSPKRNRYATLKRQTDPKEVDAFLGRITAGQEQTYPIQGLPGLKAAEVETEVMEEEIDLSELEDVEVGDVHGAKKDEL